MLQRSGHFVLNHIKITFQHKGVANTGIKKVQSLPFRSGQIDELVVTFMKTQNIKKVAEITFIIGNGRSAAIPD